MFISLCTQIYGNDGEIVLNGATGSERPERIVYDGGNELVLIFHSDYSETRMGFELRYSFDTGKTSLTQPDLNDRSFNHFAASNKLKSKFKNILYS